jgi:RNA polymerase sigma-70 factor (ECF subfamily)
MTTDERFPHCACFLPLAGAAVPPSASLEAALEGLLERARAAWPQVRLEEDRFLTFVAVRLPQELAPADGLGQLRAEDLYLACGCLHGDAAAVRSFQQSFYPVIAAALRHMDPGFPYVEDVQQVVYERVFMATEDHAPRIAQYAGRGALQSWIRVMAVRLGQNLLRSRRRERSLGDSNGGPDLADGLDLDDGAELHQLKRLYRQEFNDAFRDALGALEPRDRNLLRLRVLEGFTTDRIAALYHVHRMTVSRWFSAIQQQLLLATRRHLADRIGASPEDVLSLVRLLQSQLDVSIRRYLDRAPEAPE